MKRLKKGIVLVIIAVCLMGLFKVTNMGDSLMTVVSTVPGNSSLNDVSIESGGCSIKEAYESFRNRVSSGIDAGSERLKSFMSGTDSGTTNSFKDFHISDYIKLPSIQTDKEALEEDSKDEVGVVGTLEMDNGMDVYFFDVGQGDATLFVWKESVMLVDTGDKDKATDIVENVQKVMDQNELDEIDALVVTHPDSDHFGGADEILLSFDVDEFYMPDCSCDTAAYRDVIEAAEDTDTQIIHPCEGDTIAIPNTDITVLSPATDYDGAYDDKNAYSIGLKVVYGQTSYVLCGDAPASSEKQMIQTGYDLKADVLKLSHHGSYSATCNEFLNAVSPKYAIVSVGLGNSYGLPHQVIMDKLKKNNIDLFRTDLQGTIVSHSDGASVSFNMEPTQFYLDGDAAAVSMSDLK